jgi:hypothetical protein
VTVVHHTGSSPVSPTEGGNPETLKEKVADSTERRQILIHINQTEK